MLAIVGSREFLNPNAYAIALPHVTLAATLVRPDWIISGGAEGMDEFAKAFAQSALFAFRGFPPSRRTWKGEGGFEDRNNRMATACTHLLSVRCAGAKTYGSGWTADRAQELGRQVVRVVIPVVGMVPAVYGSWS